jgi:hypothetical protein
MMETPYSLVIETTDDADYFGFYLQILGTSRDRALHRG